MPVFNQKLGKMITLTIGYGMKQFDTFWAKGTDWTYEHGLGEGSNAR